MRLSTNTIYNMSMQSVLRQQSKVAGVGQQLASGKSVVTPADDPRAASQALTVAQSAAVNDQFAASRNTARRNLSAEGNELSTVVDALTAAKGRLVQAGNGTLSDADRNSIATQLEGVYSQLLGSANAQDGNGRYLFSGYDDGTVPFAKNADESVSYQGDQGQRQLQVDASRLMPINDSGTAVFAAVTDSAQYVASAADDNTGTAVYTNLSVADSSATTYGDTFEVTFADDGTQTTYTVTDTATGDSSTAAFQAGKPIDLGGGMRVSFDGAPADGDSFTVARDRPEDNNILNTFNDLINRLKAGTDTPAKAAALSNSLNSAQRKLDNSLDNVSTVQASLGARLNELDTLDTVGESRAINYKSTLSQLQDLDYVPAISDYSLAQVALQFSQQTFTDIQKLSMFNMG